MGNYKNGLETKEILYKSSKKLFLEKGYEKTTVKDIITDAKTKQALLNYYFESKEKLAVQIYKDFCNDIIFCIENTPGALEEKESGLLSNLIFYRSYFKALCCRPEITRFYTEVSKLPIFADTMIEMRDYFFTLDMEGEQYKNIRPELKDRQYFEYLKSLTTGMEVQIFRDVFTSRFSIDLEDAVDLFLHDYHSFLFLDMAKIDENIEKSRKAAARFTFDVDSFFNVTMKIG